MLAVPPALLDVLHLSAGATVGLAVDLKPFELCKFCAHTPMIKPNRMNATEVSRMSVTIQAACMIDAQVEGSRRRK